MSMPTGPNSKGMQHVLWSWTWPLFLIGAGLLVFNAGLAFWNISAISSFDMPCSLSA